MSQSVACISRVNIKLLCSHQKVQTLLELGAIWLRKMLTYLRNKGLYYKEKWGWPLVRHWTPKQGVWMKWLNFICDHCLAAGTFHNGSTCQFTILLLNKFTNSPSLFCHVSGTRPLLLWSTLPLIISPLNDTATPQVTSRGLKKKDFLHLFFVGA